MANEAAKALALDAAGIMDALRREQVADQDGEARYTELCDTFGGFIGICDAAVDAAEAMEMLRAKIGPDVAWGEELPHPYEAWDAVAEALWREVDGSNTAEVVERAVLRMLVGRRESP